MSAPAVPATSTDGHAGHSGQSGLDGLDRQVAEALQEVYDPCSQSWQRPMSLVDLGLVRAVEVDDTGRALVRISLTAPFCMAVPVITRSIERKVGEVPGITGVRVELDGATLWRPELMTDRGRELLAAAREGDRRTLPLV
ncbi:metal-sulfur cluster assembly factor [Streptomyces sp. Je 1-332]|uniref:metal-sulfur cluster assembly factor n=1 Tax=Streptomyces sp. Je 1-332 TaxID=3231270 RepID=UPI00345AB3F2